METRWLYRTSEDLGKLREEAAGVCVIPMGCVEKHGLHLPLGTDSIEAEAIALAASKLETVCIFPTYVFGDFCIGSPAMPDGTVTIPMDMMMDRLGIESGLSTHEADYLKAAGIKIRDDGWDVNYPNFYAGHDPVGCNERIAALSFRMAAERLARTYKAYKEDENILRWHEEMQAGW